MLFRKTAPGDSVKIVENGKKIWEITKGYDKDTFEDNSSSIGYRIDVYQESINQTVSEFLVNFDYLNRVMSAYGFELVSRDEAKDMGLPDGSGLFSELFSYMEAEIEKNKFKAKDYLKAPYMTGYEKKISFLNRYFIYKKMRTVNLDDVKLELGEYAGTDISRNMEDTEHAQEVASKEVETLKPKVRKLNKKILLVAATDAVDDAPVPKATKKATSAKVVKRAPKTTSIKAQKKTFIVEDDDEGDSDI